MAGVIGGRERQSFEWRASGIYVVVGEVGDTESAEGILYVICAGILHGRVRQRPSPMSVELGSTHRERCGGGAHLYSDSTSCRTTTRHEAAGQVPRLQ